MPIINTGKDYRIGTTRVLHLYAGAVHVWPESRWPLGVIVHYYGIAAPEGWAICDGSPHGSPALELLLGSPNTPDLTNMFVRTTAGGADTVNLTMAHLPSHGHPVLNDSSSHVHTGTLANAGGSHTHTASPGYASDNHYHHLPAANSGGRNVDHSHTQVLLNDGEGESGDGGYADSNPTSQGSVKNVGTTHGDAGLHAHSIPASNTGTVNTWHQHSFDSSAANVDHTHVVAIGGGAHSHTLATAGGSEPLPVLPRHMQLLFIIRKGGPDGWTTSA